VDTGSRDGWTEEESLDELAQLAKTAGSQVVGRMIQKLDFPNRLSYLGKGNLEELILKRKTSDWMSSSSMTNSVPPSKMNWKTP
jgi:GTP-binding protein HflX